jgi:FkbM family methyltransferase
MLRSLVERLMRNRRVKRRLPNGVPIYLSPDSQLKYLKSKFDIDLSQMAEKFVTNSSVVWDVGANCGVMAFNAAKARQILAIEADPFLAHLIQESVALNGVPVTVVAAAAFSRPSLAEFSIARRGRASNYLTAVGGHTQSAGERSRIVVPTITLDSLLERFDPPTFIKMDVEGAEVEVLEGASRILSEVRPIFYYEAGTSTTDRCNQILASAGYKVTRGAEMNWLAEPQ